MKEKILEILGKNHKTPIQFNSANYSEIYGLYTFRGGVYVFRDGVDLDFEEELTIKEREKVLEMVESKDWVLNKALQ